MLRLAGLAQSTNLPPGVYNTAEKRFSPNTFRGAYEIVSLTGTISTMNGKHYSHIHMSAGDGHGPCVRRAFEPRHHQRHRRAVIRILNGQVDRAFDAQTGLNLFRFA